MTAYFVLGYPPSVLALEYAIQARRVLSLIASFRDAVLLSRVPDSFDFFTVPDLVFYKAGLSRRLSERSLRLADLVLRHGFTLSNAQFEVGMRTHPVTRGFLIVRTMKAAIWEQLSMPS